MDAVSRGCEAICSMCIGLGMIDDSAISSVCPACGGSGFIISVEIVDEEQHEKT